MNEVFREDELLNYDSNIWYYFNLIQKYLVTYPLFVIIKENTVPITIESYSCHTTITE